MAARNSVPVTEFMKLQCPVGSVVKVTTPQGTFICKIYPKSDLKDDSVIENTVQRYSQSQNLLLKHPVVGNKHVSQCSVKPATSVAVTVVSNDFKGISKLKKCKLSATIKNLLSSKVFSKLSSLNVSQLFPDIEKIFIVAAHPESEALCINTRTLRPAHAPSLRYIRLRGHLVYTYFHRFVCFYWP